MPCCPIPSHLSLCNIIHIHSIVRSVHFDICSAHGTYVDAMKKEKEGDGKEHYRSWI